MTRNMFSRLMIGTVLAGGPASPLLPAANAIQPIFCS